MGRRGHSWLFRLEFLVTPEIRAPAMPGCLFWHYLISSLAVSVPTDSKVDLAKGENTVKGHRVASLKQPPPPKSVMRFIRGLLRQFVSTQSGALRRGRQLNKQVNPLISCYYYLIQNWVQ